MECKGLTLCREWRPHPMPRPKVGPSFRHTMLVSAEDLPEVANPKHPDHAEDRLTRAAAAKLSGATRSTIRRLEVAGALHPTIDAAGVHRFDPAEVTCVARDRAARPVDGSKRASMTRASSMRSTKADRCERS